MELFESIFQRRSIRRFTGEPVGDQEIKRILEAGRWAPSGLNNQPWRFLVVKAGDPRKEGLQAHTKYAHVVRGAQVLIAVLLEKSAMYHPMKDYQGAGACIQNMLLAIHGMGLGGVWLGEIINQGDAVMDVLGLDTQTYELMAVLALGHPDQQGSSSRKPLDELLVEEL